MDKPIYAQIGIYLKNALAFKFGPSFQNPNVPMENLVKAKFKSLLLDTTLRARAAAKSRAGYDVKHILMIGANQFTCDNLGELLAYYRSLGAHFISLDEALKDPIYSIVDEKGKPAARAIMREVKRRQLAGSD